MRLVWPVFVWPVRRRRVGRRFFWPVAADRAHWPLLPVASRTKPGRIMTAREPVWHDVGHLLPPDDTPTAPTDLHMAAAVRREHDLEALDQFEAQREQRRQQ